MVGYVVHFLELALIPDRPHEGDALPVLEEVTNRLFDLAGVLTAVLPIAGIVEAILKILRRTDFSPPFVLDLEREIAKHPQKFRHVPMQALLVVPLAQFSISFDGLTKRSDHFQLAEGSFVDGAHRVVNEIRGNEQCECEYFGIVLEVFLQTVSALGVEEEDVVVVRGVEERLRPHPNALGAAGDRRVHLELNHHLLTPFPVSWSRRLRRQLFPVRIFPTRLTKPTGMLYCAIMLNAYSTTSTFPFSRILINWIGSPAASPL